MERLVQVVERDFGLTSPTIQGSEVAWRRSADPRGEVLVACRHREQRGGGVAWQDHTCVVDVSLASGRRLPFTVEEGGSKDGSGFRASFAVRG
ncbi:hypothetical protein [Nocardioides yefusunii]|uniref:Uncharacterized protein n=1 Tax=Nocardioides yefusunii TaxID=2500546 RepID=A0ABW1QVM7_9ACTN|nr:hypothetical protein [Nocardioides yefusunii]